MTVIQASNISKAYQLGEIGTGTLSRDIERWWYKMRGKEDPFLRIDEVSDRAINKSDRDIVWSLRDINFDIQQGDAVGLIGRNGAGKSTLLKLLSRITAPTTGSIKVKGKIASLLEVGTGFHPELTGRENIYLNGAILGMRKREITRKFDEIVDFAGVQRHVDTPVKRYSSGMYVRLAFAVAAYLESEILIVDEVLAVGDIEFQKKCLGKMGNLSKAEGRTVLFVSHNMSSIMALCNRAILLRNGQIYYSGSVSDTISKYAELNTIKKGLSDDLLTLTKRSGNGSVKIKSFHLENHQQQMVDKVFSGEAVIFVFKLQVFDYAVQKISIGFSLHDANDVLLTYLYSDYQDVFYSPQIQSDIIQVKCKIDNFPLAIPKIILRVRIVADGQEADWPQDIIATFDVEQGNFFGTGKMPLNAPFLVKGNWQ